MEIRDITVIGIGTVGGLTLITQDLITRNILITQHQPILEGLVGCVQSVVQLTLHTFPNVPVAPHRTELLGALTTPVRFP